MSDITSPSFPNGHNGPNVIQLRGGPLVLPRPVFIPESARNPNNPFDIVDLPDDYEETTTPWQREQAVRDRARAWSWIIIGLTVFWGFMLWQVL